MTPAALVFAAQTDETSTFVVAPDAALVLWTLLLLATFVAGLVTAFKGHYGWALVGLVTAGLAWWVAAFKSPSPDSFWRRLEQRGNSG